MSKSNESSPRLKDSGLSRRELFRRAGLATGWAMLLGLPKFPGSWASEADAAIAARTAVPSKISLELEGQPVGFLTSVEGGNAFAEIVPEAVGPDGIQRKHPGALRFEDLIVGVPLSTDSKPLVAWITESFTKPPSARNGAIVYMDFNMMAVKRLEFAGAMLSEITVPTAEAASKNAASLILRITPQSTSLAGSSGKPALAPLGAKQKNVIAGNFRFNIQGFEAACKRIAKVSPLVARRLKLSAAGEQRLPQSPLGPWDCAPVSIFLPEADAGPFHAWFDKTVVKGNPEEDRAGLLEWLDPTLTNVLASIQLGGLGIVRYAPEPVKANPENRGLVQVDMYCETLNLML